MADVYGSDGYGAGLYEGVMAGYGAGTYGDGVYGVQQSDGYGSGFYGDGVYGGAAAGTGATVFGRREHPPRRKPVPRTPIRVPDDDEAAVALMLALL